MNKVLLQMTENYKNAELHVKTLLEKINKMKIEYMELERQKNDNFRSILGEQENFLHEHMQTHNFSFVRPSEIDARNQDHENSFEIQDLNN